MPLMQGNSGPLAENFYHPKNVGDAKEPNFIGRSASFSCGATLRISVHIDDSQRIAEAKFRAAGCTALVASASLLTEQIKGKTTGEAAALGQDAESLTKLLGVFAEQRSECPALACEALVSAIRAYSDSARDEWQGDEALICTCFGVSERTIEHEIQTNRLSAIEQVTEACKAGAGCRSCYPLIQDIIDDCWRTDFVNRKS